MKDGKGRISKRTDGLYFLTIPSRVATDSAFPFPIPYGAKGVDVKVSFKEGKLIVEKISKEPDSSS